MFNFEWRFYHRPIACPLIRFSSLFTQVTKPESEKRQDSTARCVLLAWNIFLGTVVGPSLQTCNVSRSLSSNSNIIALTRTFADDVRVKRFGRCLFYHRDRNQNVRNMSELTLESAVKSKVLGYRRPQTFWMENMKYEWMYWEIFSFEYVVVDFWTYLHFIAIRAERCRLSTRNRPEYKSFCCSEWKRASFLERSSAHRCRTGQSQVQSRHGFPRSGREFLCIPHHGDSCPRFILACTLLGEGSRHVVKFRGTVYKHDLFFPRHPATNFRS